MRSLFLGALLLACASAPRPKAPDESHRIPVNRTAPPELARPVGPQKPVPRELGAGESVEWR